MLNFEWKMNNADCRLRIDDWGLWNKNFNLYKE